MYKYYYTCKVNNKTHTASQYFNDISVFNELLIKWDRISPDYNYYLTAEQLILNANSKCIIDYTYIRTPSFNKELPLHISEHDYINVYVRLNNKKG